MRRTKVIRRIRPIGPIILAIAAAAPAEEAWQAHAKGLCEGPLCSLVLRVKVGKTLDLYAPGGSMDTGWGTLGPADIPLGSIGLPSTLAVAGVERTGDWSHSKAVVTLEGGAKLTLYASMLSPGIVVETSADRLRLFAGQHERMVTFDDKGKMKIHGHMGGNPAPKATITPAHIAVPHGKAIQTFATSGPVPAPPAENAWALIWWAKSSHFIRTDWPIAGHSLHQDGYLADCPMLFVFDEAPGSLSAVPEGGLDVSFARSGHRVAILPILGARMTSAELTAQWMPALPVDVASKCGTTVPFARQYPLSVREDFGCYAPAGFWRFEEKLTFLNVGEGGRKLAVYLPVVALAREMSHPSMAPSPEGSGGRGIVDLGMPTEFGPVAGIPDGDTYSWEIKGSILESLEAANWQVGADHPGLASELHKQLDRMLRKGELLAPWTYADNIPISAARGEYYWGEPGEPLYLLAQLYPVVKKEQQAALLECIADIRKAFPPETMPLIPPDKGARRGGYDVGPCQVSKTIADERGKRVSLFALYGLERYYALSGTKPTAEEWEACKKVMAAAFEEQGWATLYHLGHPNRFLPWMGKPEEREQLRKEYGATESWRGDRPCAVLNANRLFAGACGAMRLAQKMERDGATYSRAAWLLARAAVLRLALGKYPQWRYQAGLAKLPPKPDWFWAWRGRGPQNWCGDLETMDWSKPEHDVQQVIELAPDRVELGHWAGVMGDKWHQLCTVEPVAFRYLTPELAAFLRAYLKPECAAYADRIAWNQPTWYASFAEAILGYEHNMNHPSDAFEHFMARSWILGEKPEQLEKWIDIPWLERGDLFYLNKLAETIRAYRDGEP